MSTATAIGSKVSNEQRYTAARPCPVCGGHEGLPRGQDKRCTGYLSGNGRFAFCERQEAPERIESAAGPLYKHRIKPAGAAGRAKSKTGNKPGFSTLGKAASSYAEWLRTKARTLVDIGEVASYWVYRSVEGIKVCAVVRYERVDDGGARIKTYRPFHVEGDRWVVGDPRGLWPLYGADTLAAAGLILFVEGEKCADVARSLDFAATTTMHGANSSPDKSDFSVLADPTKTIVILADNDEPGREYRAAIAAKLAGLDTPPRIKLLDLPHLEEKADIADWVAQGGTAEYLRDLIEATEEWEPPEQPAGDPDGSQAVPERSCEYGHEDNPHRLARLFLLNRYWYGDGDTLRYYRDEFHAWHEGAYRPVGTREINAELSRVIETEYQNLYNYDLSQARLRAAAGEDGGKSPNLFKVSTRTVGDVNQALTSCVVVRQREVPRQPAWLRPDPPCPAESVLPARNALIDLPAFVADRRAGIHRPTPTFFGSYALDYDFAPDAPPPAEWLRFLTSLWPDDPESVATLQEWFGYNLTADTRQQKILALIGPKRSGKGTIARVLRLLIGADNVAGPTLSSLATNFGLSPLLGKPTAFISDARLSGRTDQAAVVERLLTISGEDTITVDRKHLPAWSGKLPTRFTFISNELPRLADSSGALAGRFIVLRLVESFFGREDTALMGRLTPELPGILLWAIDGWRRLNERGHFVQPETARQFVDDMESLASPHKAFIDDCCEVGPGKEIGRAELFDAWKLWCAEKGREKPGMEADFGRGLRAVLPKLDTSHKRQPDGSRKRFYQGIALAPKPEPLRAFTQWLHDELTGEAHPVAVADIITRARLAKHLPSMTFECQNPSVDDLWTVRNLIPQLGTGQVIKTIEMEGRKYWQLVEMTGPGAPHADPDVSF